MKRFLFVIMMLLVCSLGFAKDTNTASHDITLIVNPIAIIGLNNPIISLEITEPDLAGDDPIGSSNSDTRLYYTIITSSNKKITVGFSAVSPSPPTGTELSVIVDSISSLVGTPGTYVGGASEIVISDTAVDFITGIGSCVTGRGESGAFVTYTLDVNDTGSLVSEDEEIVTIEYTITDDA